MIAKTMVIGFVLTLAAVYLWKLADSTPSNLWELAMCGLVIYWLYGALIK